MLIVITVATLLFASIIPMGGYVPSNIPNPWNDLLSGFGVSSSSSGSGTTTSTTNPQNIQRTGALEGCALGGVGGALLGGGVGFIAGGPIGGIAGLILGGIGACTVAGWIGNLFPGPVTQAFNGLVSFTGPIGTFLQAIVAVEQYVYPFIQFGLDWIPYGQALILYEPAFAGLMAFFATVSGFMWMLAIAKLFRGVGTLG